MHPGHGALVEGRPKGAAGRYPGRFQHQFVILQCGGRQFIQGVPNGKPDGIKSRADGLVSIPRGANGWRRSVYVQQRRTEMPTFLTTFDLPRMEPNCVERPQSTVAPQALHLLNDATVHEIAGHFAERILKEADDESAQLTRAHWLAFSRAPSPGELQLTTAALQQLKAHWKKELGDQATAEAVHKNALTNLCRALLNASEFQYVD